MNIWLHIKNSLFFLVTLLVMSACSSITQSAIAPQKTQYTQNGYLIEKGHPVWFFNPNYENHPGAVGIAKPQKKGGYLAQKRIALAIANAELAKQIEVAVESELSRREELRTNQNQESYSEEYESWSQSEAYGLIRQSHIKDEWLNPKTGELYLWVVIDKQ